MSLIGRGAAGAQVTQLVLPVPLRQRIIAEAAGAAPLECCGLLTGRVEGARAVVTDRIASSNRAAAPLAAFEIDASLLLETQRRARDSGAVMLGHYHSHPDGPAGPSATDRARAWVPGHVWLIAAPDGAQWQFSAHLAANEKGRMTLRPLEIFAR